MLIMRGPLAQSHFRTERWLTYISDIVPQIIGLSAEFVHFVALNEELNLDENNILANLLQYGSYLNDTAADEETSEALLIVVTPKLGTISSWSNKASDLARHCGLKRVERIERGILYRIEASEKLTWGDEQAIANLLHDPATEEAFFDFEEAKNIFKVSDPKITQWVNVLEHGKSALSAANKELKLGLGDKQLNYFLKTFKELNKNTSDLELTSISEKLKDVKNTSVWRAPWIIDGQSQSNSLNAMLQYTMQLDHTGVLAAFQSNNAILAGNPVAAFSPNSKAKIYEYQLIASANIVSNRSYFSDANIPYCEAIKAETAVGRGAIPKAGFCGFSVSDFLIPGFKQDWETEYLKNHQKNALETILENSLVHSQFNNEFGRPVLGGFCRTLDQKITNAEGVQTQWGYSQPIIWLGGYSHIRQTDVKQGQCLAGMNVVIVGLEGASKLERDNIRTENPEIQCRIQALLRSCAGLGVNNPVVAIYPIGQGGLVATLVSLTQDNQIGGDFILQDILNVDPNLSPLDIWCHEVHEGYVLVVSNDGFRQFETICLRECSPFTIIGKITKGDRIRLLDQDSRLYPFDLPSTLLLGDIIEEPIQSYSQAININSSISLSKVDLDEAVLLLLRLPCVADKSYLITICDRTVTGLVAQDPLVGPWQVPVADCMITLSDFNSYQGEAMALGERTPIAILDPVASARMAVAEAITNIAGANINSLRDVKLAFNWTGKFRNDDEKALLFNTVQAVAIELCPALGVTITAVQHSLLETDQKTQHKTEELVNVPLSLTVCAFAPVTDVRVSLTPLLNLEQGETVLLFVDLSGGNQRLGQSALLQVFNQVSDAVPDLDSPELLKAFFGSLQLLIGEDKILSYHDRSDGGLFVTLCEMAFASHVGLQLDISELGHNAKSILFNEELGAVIQVRTEDVESVIAEFAENEISSIYVIGTLDDTDKISILFNEEVICIYDRVELQKTWSETNFHLQSLRDNPRSAKTQYEMINDKEDPGLNVHLTYDPAADITAPMLNLGTKPRVAILREQGIYSHLEMAAAFDRARFECVDVHMNDLVSGEVILDGFKGLAVCGGFSFGDVLGAGQGWAKRILFSPQLKNQFEQFFNKNDTFTLGLSNGCQMLSGLKSIIPGAELWPRFVQNYSEQFEARWCLVEVQPSASVLLADMIGSRMLVPVAHREGRAEFSSETHQEEAIRRKLVTLRYVDNRGRKTKIYPANPNGSSLGITGLTNKDGRVLIMMPHPERAFRTVQHSWHPKTWGEDGPWLRMFQNARRWVD